MAAPWNLYDSANDPVIFLIGVDGDPGLAELRAQIESKLTEMPFVVQPVMVVVGQAETEREEADAWAVVRDAPLSLANANGESLNAPMTSLSQTLQLQRLPALVVVDEQGQMITLGASAAVLDMLIPNDDPANTITEQNDAFLRSFSLMKPLQTQMMQNLGQSLQPYANSLQDQRNTSAQRNLVADQDAGSEP